MIRKISFLSTVLSILLIANTGGISASAFSSSYTGAQECHHCSGSNVAGGQCCAKSKLNDVSMACCRKTALPADLVGVIPSQDFLATVFDRYQQVAAAVVKPSFFHHLFFKPVNSPSSVFTSSLFIHAPPLLASFGRI